MASNSPPRPPADAFSPYNSINDTLSTVSVSQLEELPTEPAHIDGLTSSSRIAGSSAATDAQCNLLNDRRAISHVEVERNTEKDAGDRDQSTKVDACEPPFLMGDHVYQWCSFAGIPAVYQHHGIVEDLWQEGGEWILRIADFSNWTPGAEEPTLSKKSLQSSSSSAGSCIRVYESSTATAKWYKVDYNVKSNYLKHHLFSRSGTFTSAESSPPGLVRARLEYLISHPEVLPPYDKVRSNCECVAVWCKTGTWATLQATSWLATTAAGQVKSTATIAGMAAGTQVTVPAAGLWGWLGYTTHASLLATQPLLVPAIAAYGVVTVGTPLFWLWRARKEWEARTIDLNRGFWEAAVDHPDVFVECITEWSAHCPARNESER